MQIKKHPLDKLHDREVFLIEGTFGDKLMPIWRDHHKLLKYVVRGT
jgi:hypothetical protein